LNVPVYSLRDVETAWFEQSAPVPVDVQGALERLGFQVRRTVGWAPVEIDREQQLFVPMGEVEIVPVAARAMH
jgi:hypothetical protein